MDENNTKSNVLDAEHKNKEDSDIPESLSSSSFHSLSEELHTLNMEEDCEFSKPDFMNQSCTPQDIKNEKDSDVDEFNINEDEYYIDEEYLKDLEVDLTEDLKLERHNNALEYKIKGNVQFQENKFEEAASQYTLALKICPLCFKDDRAIFYGNRAAARSKLTTDSPKEIIKDCDRALELRPTYCKVLSRRANLLEESDKLDEALADYQKVLELNPENSEARYAVAVLPEKINKRNEKLKTEMMGKLKDLGNMVLKPFGLSTNNFEMKQDSTSGGYTINFKQNPT